MGQLFSDNIATAKNIFEKTVCLFQKYSLYLLYKAGAQRGNGRKNKMANSQTKIIGGQACIWLQYYGWAPAKPASEFSIGERMLFNFGTSACITEIKDLSKSFLEITYVNKKGESYTGRIKKGRLAAFGK